MFKLRMMIAVAILCTATSGCLHTRHHRKTANQLEMLPEFYQEQVLDNLAMFAVDPGSLPFFALPGEGLNQMVDSSSVGTDLNWSGGVGPFLFSALGTEGQASRDSLQSWKLSPVVDPRKLARMRCAYQFAIANQSLPMGSEGLAKAVHCQEDGNPAACLPIQDGCQWFGIGGKHDVPSCRGCTYVGNHCGTYVWVLPGCRDQLARLTMLIMEYSFREPNAAATRKIEYFVDAQGLPVPEAEAVAKVEQSALADSPVERTWFDEEEVARIVKWREKGFDLIGLGRQTRRLFNRTILSFVRDENLAKENYETLLQGIPAGDEKRVEAEYLLKQLHEIQKALNREKMKDSQLLRDANIDSQAILAPFNLSTESLINDSRLAREDYDELLRGLNLDGEKRQQAKELLENLRQIQKQIVEQSNQDESVLIKGSSKTQQLQFQPQQQIAPEVLRGLYNSSPSLQDLQGSGLLNR